MLPARPSTPPQTPRKRDHPQSTGPKEATGTGTGKSKSRNKAKAKNILASPRYAGHERKTPPLAGIPTNTQPAAVAVGTPSTAYAGATFHASPAPSALPIPSFHSKSVPDSPGIRELQRLRESSTPKDAQSPTRYTGQQPEREESPLDFFFKADREEKARARSATSSHATLAGPFNPPATRPGPEGVPPASHRSTSKGPANGIFTMELDGPGQSGQSPGPAFSTPYTDRISAARQRASPQLAQPSPQLADRSAALKAYLFSSMPSSPSGPSGEDPSRAFALNGSRPALSQSSSHGSKMPSQGRLSGLRKEVTPAGSPGHSSTPVFHGPPSPGPLPSTRSMTDVGPLPTRSMTDASGTSTPFAAGTPSSLTPTANIRSPGLHEMENSLRKILKLDSVSRA